jgi:hypothetical protein
MGEPPLESRNGTPPVQLSDSPIMAEMWRHYGNKEAIMRNSLKLLAPISLIAALVACSEANEDAATEEFATAEDEYAPSPVEEAEAAADAAEDAVAEIASPPAQADRSAGGEDAPPLPSSQIPVSLPKMAYVMNYGFRLAGESIGTLQQQHADMCEAQGPYSCRIISMTRTGDEEDEIVGELQLAVASDKARGFGALLSAAAAQADAEEFRADIQGEDLSKSIVDTEARVRSRIALRDRLMEVLRTRNGKVEELVEAERQVAAVNEEIDQAQSWLREQQGRVAFSRMTLSYESATPGGSFLKPVEGAIGSLGSIFGMLAAVLIVLGSLALPVLGGILGIRALRRRLGTEAA